MKLKENFAATRVACYLGYIIQATIVNFAPLLFITFNTEFNISFDKITVLTSLNFTVQLLVDSVSAKIAGKIGYRRAVTAAQMSCGIGLVGYCLFPSLLPDPYAGLLIATVFAAIGGGLIEVLISPIIESCPASSKSASMTLLHSFYCWGQAAVVLFSTLFFTAFGIKNWRVLACAWALLPALNTFLFAQVPILTPESNGEKKSSAKALFSDTKFLLLLILMLCAGASEIGMSQWASAFAEGGLGVSKAVGDLAGPCLFAILMGTARTLYVLISHKVSLMMCMSASGVLCVISYLLATVVQDPAINLVGCALCGFSVGIMWPGTISISAKLCPNGGTLMFGILALFGDIGCSLGTGAVGIAAGIFGGFKAGLLTAAVFPVVLLFALALCKARYKLDE